MYDLCTCVVVSLAERQTLHCGLLAGHEMAIEHWALVPTTGKVLRWPQWDGKY